MSLEGCLLEHRARLWERGCGRHTENIHPCLPSHRLGAGGVLVGKALIPV